MNGGMDTGPVNADDMMNLTPESARAAVRIWAFRRILTWQKSYSPNRFPCATTWTCS